MPPIEAYDTYKLRRFTERVGDQDETFFGSTWVSEQAKVRRKSVSDFRRWLQVGKDDGIDDDRGLKHAWPRDRDGSLPGDPIEASAWLHETLSTAEKPASLSVVQSVRFENDHLKAYLDALQHHSEALSQGPASETDTKHVRERAELMRQYTGMVLTYLNDHLLQQIWQPIDCLTGLWEVDDYTEKKCPAFAPLERRTERLINPGPPVAGHSLEQFKELRCIYSAKRALTLRLRLKYEEALPEYLSVYSDLQRLRTSFDTVRNKAATALTNSRPKTPTEVSESPLKPMNAKELLDLRFQVESSHKDLKLMLGIYKITDQGYYNTTMDTLNNKFLRLESSSVSLSLMKKAISTSTAPPAGSVKSKESSGQKKKKSPPVTLTTDDALRSPNATSNGSESEQTEGHPACSVSNASDNEAASTFHEAESPHCKPSEPSQPVSASQEATVPPESAPLTWAEIARRRNTTTAGGEIDSGSPNHIANVRPSIGSKESLGRRRP